MGCLMTELMIMLLKPETFYWGHITDIFNLNFATGNFSTICMEGILVLVHTKEGDSDTKLAGK